MTDQAETSARVSANWQAAAGSRPSAPSRKAFWIRQIILWHWVSSAVCLGAMLLFTVTGITLNHAAQIPAKLSVKNDRAVLPDQLAKALQQVRQTGKHPLPDSLNQWLAARFHEKNFEEPAEWSESEIYISLPRPGGDAWISIDRASGKVEWEQTQRGWIAYLNDLHKGRHTGFAWQVFIDVMAVAFLVFTATGLTLLQIHSSKRRSTWPLIAFGFALPALLLLLLTHM